MKRACAALLAAAAALGAAPAGAHDVGVTRADLVEHEGGRYTLRARVDAGAAYQHPPPVLPARCAFTGNPRGTPGPQDRTWEFSCTPALHAGDTLLLPWSGDGAMLTARWLAGGASTRLFQPHAGRIAVRLADLRAGSGSLADAARRYTALGVEHILLGIDHLLFVVALLIVVRGGWMLVQAITGFTIAHSITLGLATLGFVEVPRNPVEAAIALSIAFVCAEILHARRGRPGVTYRRPWVAAFLFGLLHGLGFAGALSDVGLPPGEVPLALLFFNVGVEAGQLLFVAVALSTVHVLGRLQPLQRAWPGLAAAYAIGTLATYWFLERTAAIVASG